MYAKTLAHNEIHSLSFEFYLIPFFYPTTSLRHKRIFKCKWNMKFFLANINQKLEIKWSERERVDKEKSFYPHPKTGVYL